VILFTIRLTIVTCMTRINSFVNEWTRARFYIVYIFYIVGRFDPKRHNGIEIRSQSRTARNFRFCLRH